MLLWNRILDVDQPLRQLPFYLVTTFVSSSQCRFTGTRGSDRHDQRGSLRQIPKDSTSVWIQNTTNTDTDLDSGCFDDTHDSIRHHQILVAACNPNFSAHRQRSLRGNRIPINARSHISSNVSIQKHDETVFAIPASSNNNNSYQR
mmetsp:Transcript_24611/g.27187  ORF Transcript_24611/g.27187 Transcript_24611/m.27187 type:complete len:146 (-) Transcript_24611:267-704(-)